MLRTIRRAWMLIVAVVVWAIVVAPFLWRWRVEAESVRLLAAATSTNELSESVGDLGIFLQFPDASWVAIRYRDMHIVGDYSLAVARDSGGGWHVSRKHHCGRFALYRQMAAKHREAFAELGCDGVHVPFRCETIPEVHALARSSDLEQARRHLIAMGFTAMDGD